MVFNENGDEELKNWIKEAIKQKYSEKDIKSILSKSGYEKKEISEALSRYFKQNKIARKILKKPKKRIRKMKMNKPKNKQQSMLREALSDINKEILILNRKKSRL
ncbi:hypothetical protein HY212_03215 [Candidatus Pacearchaeota archaeon]|nr:hypothetical protein [Candidatus Pacearchaeota archaeon]